MRRNKKELAKEKTTPIEMINSVCVEICEFEGSYTLCGGTYQDDIHKDNSP